MDRGRQAFRILQITFTVAPVLAGLDKFFYILTDWSQYLSPFAMQLIQYQDGVFMSIVGIIEILAGLGVLWKPRLFSYIVALWLLCVVGNLVMTGNYLDIALRDLGLFFAAIALGRLSSQYSSR